MKFWELIKNAIEDISDDIDLHVQRTEEDRRENPAKYIGQHGDSRVAAWMAQMIPHLIGGVFGFAVAELFHCGLIGHIIFVISAAFLMGTYKSHEFDKIAWKYALIKNALLMSVWIAVFAGFLILFHFYPH